jgi:hypothetical protein
MTQNLKPSRRALLSAAATLAPIAIVNATPFQSPAIASPIGGDAALVAGAKLIAELAQKAKVAEDAWSKCEERFEEIRPRKPEALLWGLGSPVRYARGTSYRKNGREYLWCSTDQIEEFRHKTFFMYSFMGSGEPSEAHDTEFLETHWPVEGWERWVDKKRQKSFAKLLAAYDEWIAADNAARVMSGIDAAGDVLADADDAVWQVYDQMLEITPTTMEGFRAMATACALACWEGKINPGSYGVEMVSKIMSGLTGMPIVHDDEEEAA